MCEIDSNNKSVYFDNLFNDNVSRDSTPFLNPMTARRMDISALLCGGGDDDDPSNNISNNHSNNDPNSPLITDPVILAPHLRGKHAQVMPTTPPGSIPSNHNYILGPRDVALSSSPTTKTSPTAESMPDAAHHKPRTIDALIHHPPPPALSPRAPRPSSSSSVNALLNPHPVRSSSSSSPFVCIFSLCYRYHTYSL